MEAPNHADIEMDLQDDDFDGEEVEDMSDDDTNLANNNSLSKFEELKKKKRGESTIEKYEGALKRLRKGLAKKRKADEADILLESSRSKRNLGIYYQ